MKDNLTISLILNDLKRNKMINMTLFLFIFISGLLMATGVLVIDRLSGSLDQIFEIAKPPHYLQMHVGELDRHSVQAFSEQTNLVKQLEIQDMVNIEGVNISFKRADGSSGSFSDSLLDNYFVVQNKHFDYLVDLDNQIVKVQKNEIGIPVVYANSYNIKVGDSMVVNVEGKTVPLTVKYIVRDAQMGSSLASSIRFLVNKADYQVISKRALRHESIIGFRLNKEEDINQFNTLYNQASSNMPKNGIGITLPLIKIVNSIGDGLMSAVIILVGIILMTIAIFNMRFTIQSTLEDEIREIGTLKAIGLKNREINNLYKSKYRLFTLVACLLAALSSFALVNFFMGNISLNFGLSKATAMTYIFPFIAVVIVYIIVMFSLRRILKTISKMSVLNALVDGEVTTHHKKKKHKKIFPAYKALFPSTDLSLSLHDYKLNLKSWFTYIFVFFLGTFSILMPLNMYMTLTSPLFVNYVGAARSDLRISIEYQPALKEMIQDIENKLSTDKEVKSWNKFKNIRGKIEGENGKMSFLLEAGDYSTFKIEMDEGHLPESDNEIALSALNADRLKLSMGDTLNIEINHNVKPFKVVGLYQDITNGGLTARIKDFGEGDIIQYAFFVDVEDNITLSQFVDRWSQTYKEAKVIEVDKLLNQTLGSITGSLLTAVIAIFILSLLIIGLISVLFITLRMHKNYAEDATLLAIGYKVRAVRLMYVYKSLLSITIGVCLGVMTSLFLGESIMSLILTIMAFGLTRITFLLQPIYLILFGILAPVIIGLALTWLVTNKISKTSVMHLGHE